MQPGEWKAYGGYLIYYTHGLYHVYSGTLEDTVRLVTVNNLEESAMWTNGSVKGTSLPPKERIVEWYDPHFSDGSDLSASVGDWVVKYPSGFSPYTQKHFDLTFYTVDFKARGQ